MFYLLIHCLLLFHATHCFPLLCHHPYVMSDPWPPYLNLVLTLVRWKQRRMTAREGTILCRQSTSAWRTWRWVAHDTSLLYYCPLSVTHLLLPLLPSFIAYAKLLNTRAFLLFVHLYLPLILLSFLTYSFITPILPLVFLLSNAFYLHLPFPFHYFLFLLPRPSSFPTSFSLFMFTSGLSIKEI